MESTKERSVLITGATGFVGSHLTGFLDGLGYQVWATGSRTRPPSMPASVRYVSADICDQVRLAKCVDDVTAVVHTAALLHLNRVNHEMECEYRRVNVEGTRAMLALAEQKRATKFIFLSTANVYGPSRDRVTHDENARLCPQTLYAQTKVEGEAVALQFPGATILRPAAVYGPGMKGNYNTLVALVRRGLYLRIGRHSPRRTLVYVEDLCEAIVRVLSARATSGVYNVTDGGFHTLDDIVDTIATTIGRHPVGVPVPTGLASTAGRAAEGACRMLRIDVSPQSLVEKYTEDFAVCGRRFIKSFGFEPRFDLESGWRHTLLQSTLDTMRNLP